MSAPRTFTRVCYRHIDEPVRPRAMKFKGGIMEYFACAQGHTPPYFYLRTSDGEIVGAASLEDGGYTFFTPDEYVDALEELEVLVLAAKLQGLPGLVRARRTVKRMIEGALGA